MALLYKSYKYGELWFYTADMVNKILVRLFFPISACFKHMKPQWRCNNFIGIKFRKFTTVKTLILTNLKNVELCKKFILELKFLFQSSNVYPMVIQMVYIFYCIKMTCNHWNSNLIWKKAFKELFLNILLHIAYVTAMFCRKKNVEYDQSRNILDWNHRAAAHGRGWSQRWYVQSFASLTWIWFLVEFVILALDRNHMRLRIDELQAR